MIKLKNDKQIDGIRSAGSVLSKILGQLKTQVAPGVSTADLDATARDLIATLGGRAAFLGYMGFPAAICTSVNEAVIHGIPNGRKLRNGDIVSIDCGIELGGFYADAAITVAVGSVAAEIEELLQVTHDSLYLGIEQARAGNRVNDISRAIYRCIKSRGYGVVRPYCGHGVGLAIHEDPQIPNYVGSGKNPRLKPGMVVAIEPMVNLGGDDVVLLDDDWTVVSSDRTVSAHYEHTVAILDSGPEILTPWE